MLCWTASWKPRQAGGYGLQAWDLVQFLGTAPVSELTAGIAGE